MNDSHDLTNEQTVPDTVNVADADVVAAGSFTFNRTEGSATRSNVAVAPFPDRGYGTAANHEDADDYSATIAWGDGSGDTATSANGGIVEIGRATCRERG